MKNYSGEMKSAFQRPLQLRFTAEVASAFCAQRFQYMTEPWIVRNNQEPSTTAGLTDSSAALAH